jgi:ABC-type glycerol-3-phosphate transport system substrate-binding protein
MGNNVAYEAGSVGIIHNSMSVFSKLRSENHPLFPSTKILPIPGGPRGQFLTASGSTALIFKNGKQTDLAKKFMIDFFEMGYYTNLVEAIGGMWVPTIEGAEQTPFWRDPVNRGFYDTVANAIGPGSWPAPDNELTAQISAQQTGVKTVQKILIQGMDPQQALNEWEAECKRILGQR